MATEKRLIDANALLETGSGIKMIVPVNCHPYEAIRIQGNAFRKAVEEAPTVDAVEVVHGHNLKDYNSAFECSVCGWEDWDTLTADTSEYNYCPNCGAKMDGDGNG